MFETLVFPLFNWIITNGRTDGRTKHLVHRVACLQPKNTSQFMMMMREKKGKDETEEKKKKRWNRKIKEGVKEKNRNKTKRRKMEREIEKITGNRHKKVFIPRGKNSWNHKKSETTGKKGTRGYNLAVDGWAGAHITRLPLSPSTHTDTYTQTQPQLHHL